MCARSLADLIGQSLSAVRVVGLQQLSPPTKPVFAALIDYHDAPVMVVASAARCQAGGCEVVIGAAISPNRAGSPEGTVSSPAPEERRHARLA